VLLDRAPDAPIGPLAAPTEHVLVAATSDLQRLAIDRQPALQRARLDVEHAEAELASARLDYKPDFTVQAGYLLMPNQTDSLLARVGITWPRAPWSHARVDAHVAEQASSVDVARVRLHATENSVRLSVQQAYVHAHAAEERASLLRTTILPQAQQMVEVSRIAYEADRGDFQTMLDAERMVLNANLDYFRAVTDFSQAAADLERAIGTDLPADAVAPVPASEGR
jgi:cobalt-zinc-cadmium efflux system outer membrane protein